MRFTGDYSSTHRLADGTAVRLRLLRRSDREKLVAAFDRLSPESRYRRFFTAMPRLPEKLLRRLFDIDGWNHVAIGAETMTADPAEAEGVGIARFIRLKDQPAVAEAAVTVVDHMQRRGVGKLLVSALAQAARERGITRFRAEVLRTNGAILALLHATPVRPARRRCGLARACQPHATANAQPAPPGVPPPRPPQAPARACGLRGDATTDESRVGRGPGAAAAPPAVPARGCRLVRL